MSRNRVTEKDHGWKRIKGEIQAAQGSAVKVGILSDSEAHDDGTDMVMIAAANEFGAEIPVTDKMRGFFAYKFGVNLKKSTTKITIPERSFIRGGYDQNQRSLQRTKQRAWGLVLDGKLTARGALGLIGEEHQGQVREFMIALSEPGNSGLTERNKNSSNPLVNEGRLVDSVRWEYDE